MRFIVLAALLMSGYASAATAQAPAPTSLPGYQVKRSDLVHDATGMRFPAKVGKVVREPNDSTNVEGDYAIVRYRVPLRGGSNAIVYIGIVHLEGMTALEHYGAFRGQIMATLPGATARHEGAFPVRGAIGEGYRGEFVGKEQAAGLITAYFGYWSARLRTQYPADQIDEAQAAITAFVNKLDWAPLRTNPAGTPVSPLVGTRWQLVQFQSSDDAIGTIKPADPTRYTLEFDDDGAFAMRLDCNRGRGLWSASAGSATDGNLTLGQAAMTRAACPPGSMDTRIAADAARVRSYTLAGDTLNLALEADGGIYTWRRLP